MGATTSSAQRDGRCDEDAAAEQRTAEASDARDDADADDTLLQGNGQISSLNLKTKSNADEITGHFEERVLSDVCAGFVPVKEDDTETIVDLQDVVSLQPNSKNEDREMNNEDSVTVKEETVEIREVNNINEVGFKKVFRFVGFKFTLKKDTCEKTEGEESLENDQERLVGTLEDSNDAKEKNESSLFEDTPDELFKNEESVQPEHVEQSEKPENGELDQSTGEVEQNVENRPDKDKVFEEDLDSEEPMSPIKQFFTQGIFSSLRRKKKEDEIQKETKEDDLALIEQTVDEKSEKVDRKCMCLDIPYIMYEEEKDTQQKYSKLLPEEELQHSPEKDKVQGSPLKRLFRKFSSRRQRESKAVENMIEDGEKVTEQPESSLEMTEVQKAKELVDEESKLAVDKQAADVSPEESTKKSDSSVSWEALICGSSAKKRARKTTADGEKQDNREEYVKLTESPLESSIEGDYDHLTSSNEQDGEVDAGSTWKTFKKLVTPKRKVRTGESSSSEHTPSDGENTKDDSFSIKKLIPGRKKRKSDGRQEPTSSDETGKDAETDDEDDETPAIIPLSEYEIIEPESVKDVNEKQVKITIEHEMPEADSPGQDTPSESEPKRTGKVSNNDRPLIIRVISEDFEEFTDFISKHQQLSDIPEEGIIEESVETPTSSAEWTTQNDSLAEDIVDLTADAVTAPEPTSEDLIGDNSTEMVSAVSQLTESPSTSGHVTPVSAEYDVQMFNVILQEAKKSIMTPSGQSVTTKNESHESQAVSYSSYIIQSTTPEETKVFVAHMKTEATAICTGLISQEIKPEECLSAPSVEAIHEVSDSVPTELVPDNLTDAHEEAGLGIDKVYEAKAWEVKTGSLESISTNEKENAATKTKQVNHLLTETLMEVSEESHVVECLTQPVTGTELRSVKMTVTDKLQCEAVLDHVIPENSQCHERQVTAEVEKDSTQLEDKVHAKVVKLKHVDVHVLQVDVEDAIANTGEMEADSDFEAISAGDSAVLVEDICEKIEETGEEKIVQEIKKIYTEQSSNDVALQEDQNIESEHISETAFETLVSVQFEEKQLHMANTEVSDNVFVEQTAKVDKVTTEFDVSSKEMDTDVNNIKVEESTSEVTDIVGTTEKDKLALAKSNKLENQCVFEIIEQEVETDKVETAHAVRRKCVPEISVDVLEHKETTLEPESSSEVILTDLERSSVMSQDEANGGETDKRSQDIEHSSEAFKNEQTLTTEKDGKGLEMDDIDENTTKQLETENFVEVEPVARSEEEENTTTMTEISAKAISSGQMVQAKISTETKETLEIRDTIPDVTQLEPVMTQNDATVQMDENSVTEQKYQSTENTKQLLEKPMAELQEEEAEIKEINKAASIVKVPPMTSEMKAETPPEVSVLERQTQVATELETATLDVIESRIETPVVADGKIETVVVPKLGLETSVVTEPDIETPVVTSKAETVDTHTSAQNTDIDTSLLATENQMMEVSTVTPSDLGTPVVTLVSTSVVIPSMEDISDVTLELKAPPINPMLDTVVKMQNVIPVVETPAVSSVMVTESVPVEEITETETLVKSPLLETPIVSVPAIKLNEPLVSKTSTVTTVLEMSNVPQSVDSVIPVVLVTEPEPPIVDTPSETSVLSPEVKTPVIFITLAEPVNETSALVSEIVSEDVDPVLAAGTLFVKPEVETRAVTAPANTSEVKTQDLDSMMVTDAASPTVTPSVTLKAETSFLSPEVETSAVQTSAVVQTPALVSVVIKDAAYPITPTVTAVVEISVVEGPSSPSALADTSVMIPEITTLPEVPVETSDVTLAVQTPAADGLMETSTEIPVPEELQVTLAVETSATDSMDVTLDVLPVVKETKSEVSAEAKEDDVPQPVTVKEEVKRSSLTEECISFEENACVTPVITSPEPHSEVDDDVWEDAVDNTGDDHYQITQTDVSPHDKTVKRESDSAV